MTAFLFLPFSSSTFLMYGTTVLLFSQLTWIGTHGGGQGQSHDLAGHLLPGGVTARPAPAFDQPVKRTADRTTFGDGVQQLDELLGGPWTHGRRRAGSAGRGCGALG